MSSRTSAEHPSCPGKTEPKHLLYFLAVWIPYALLVKHFWWVCDDAFISFRYALNAASGEGLRFNLGSHIPVEGYSNFLWVMVAAVVEFLGAEITFWPNLLSFLCGSTLLYLVFHNLRYRLEINTTTSCLATLFLGLSPPFALWSTSGLETAPFALLIFLTFERLILRKGAIAPISAGLAGLALSLMRTEGIYWAVTIVLLAMVSRKLASEKFGRGISICSSIILTGYGIYWISRYSYYQLPFSNTTYAKVSIGLDVMGRGLDYVALQSLTYLPLLIVIPGILIVLFSKKYAIGLPVAAMSVGITAYAILVGGDFMPMARLLVPAMPFNCLLMAWILDSVWKKTTAGKQISVLLGIIVIGIGLAPSWNLQLAPESVRARFHFRLNERQYRRSEYDQWLFARDNARLWAMAGITLKAHADPGDSVVRGAMGAVAYYSGLFIFDKAGLVTRSVVLHTAEDRSLNSPGHDKHVPGTFFMDQKPTFYRSECVERKELTRKAVGELSGLYAPGVLNEFGPTGTKWTEQDAGGKFNHSKQAKYLLLIRSSDNGGLVPEFVPLIKDQVKF